MSRGMSPFAARRGATDVSFASTCSSFGMPHHTSSFSSLRTRSDIGFPQYLDDLPDQFLALNVDAKTKTIEELCPPQNIGDISNKCDNSTIKVIDVEMDSVSKPPGTLLGSSSGFEPPVTNTHMMDNISKPPGTFLGSSFGFAPPITSIHMLDPIAVVRYPQPAAYQWLNSSTAYQSNSTARDDHNDRHRTPRRQKCEQVVQDVAKEIDWEQRLQDRTLAVRNLKITSEYIDNQDVVPRPVTPDPSARMNKRPWEKVIAEWRGEWREIDALRKLEKLGHENDIRDAWQKAKENMDSQLPHNQEAQLEVARKILMAK